MRNDSIRRDRMVEACLCVLRDVQAGVPLQNALNWQRIRRSVPQSEWTEFENMVRKALVASRLRKGVKR